MNYINNDKFADSGFLSTRAKTFTVFALFCLLMVSDFVDRMMIAAILPSIKLEWGLSDTQLGLLNSVLYIGMLLFAIPFAYLTDHWGRVKTGGLMGVFWSISTFLGSFADRYAGLLTSRAAVGVGESGYAPAAYAWIYKSFPTRFKQLALGLFSSCQTIGMALGVGLGGYLTAHHGWRSALGILALPGLLIALLLFVFKSVDYPSGDSASLSAKLAQSDSDKLPHHQMNYWKSFKQIIGTKSLMFSFLASAMSQLQAGPLLLFLPTFMMRYHGIPLQTSSLLTSVVMLSLIAALPLGGWVMGKYNVSEPNKKIRWTRIAYIIITLIYLALFTLVQDWRVQFTLILAITFIMAFVGTASIQVSQELAPAGSRALASACGIVLLHLAGSAPGPFLTGVFSDWWGLKTGLLIVGVFGGIASVLFILLVEKYYLSEYHRHEEVTTTRWHNQVV